MMMGRDQAFMWAKMNQIWDEALVPMAEGDIDFGHYSGDFHLFLIRVLMSPLPEHAEQAGVFLKEYAQDREGQHSMAVIRASTSAPMHLYEAFDAYVVGMLEWLRHLLDDGDGEELLELLQQLLRYHAGFGILGPEPASEIRMLLVRLGEKR